MNELWYSETALAAKLNVTKNGLQNFRSDALQDGEWKKIGREIYLAPRALNKVLELTGNENVDCSDCLLQKNGEPPGPAIEELMVKRIFPNPHLVLCVKPANGSQPATFVLVRVPMNKNFRPTMILRAKPDPNNPTLYRLEGRCPRFPGRW
jgi:hypothetical protein